MSKENFILEKKLGRYLATFTWPLSVLLEYCFPKQVPGITGDEEKAMGAHRRESWEAQKVFAR